MAKKTSKKKTARRTGGKGLAEGDVEVVIEEEETDEPAEPAWVINPGGVLVMVDTHHYCYPLAVGGMDGWQLGEQPDDYPPEPMDTPEKSRQRRVAIAMAAAQSQHSLKPVEVPDDRPDWKPRDKQKTAEA